MEGLCSVRWVALGKCSLSAWRQVQSASTGSEDLAGPSALSGPTREEEMYLPDKLFLLSTWHFVYGLLMPSVTVETCLYFHPPQIMK